MLINNFCSILIYAANICNLKLIFKKDGIYSCIRKIFFLHFHAFLYFAGQEKSSWFGMLNMGWTLKLCQVRSEAPPVHGKDLHISVYDRKMGCGEIYLVLQSSLSGNQRCRACLRMHLLPSVDTWSLPDSLSAPTKQTNFCFN